MAHPIICTLWNHTLTSWLRFALATLVVLVLTPLMVKELGIDDFGLWTLVFSVIGFFELLDFGLFNATVKYISQFSVTKDHEKRNGMLSTFLFSFYLLSFFGILLLFLGTYFSYRFFNIPDRQLQKALIVLLIIGVRTLIFGLPLSLFKGILFGQQKISLINLVSSITTLGYLVAAWMVLTRGGGIIGLAWVNFLQLVVEHLVYVICTFICMNNVKFSWKLVDFKFLKEVSSFSLMQVIGGTTSMLTIRADPIIIQFFMPLYFVGLYAVPLKIVTYLYMFIKQFTNLLGPLIVRLHVMEQEEKMKKLFLYSLKASFAVGGVILLGGGLYGANFLSLWVGETFLDVSWVFYILLISFGMNLFQIISCQILAMVDQHIQLIPIFIVMALTNILVSLALINPFGMNGVALGTLFSAVVGALMSLYPIMKKYRVSMKEIFVFSISPCIIPITACCLLYFLINPVINSMSILFFASAITVIIYSLSYLAFLNSFERQELISLIVK